MSLEQIVKLQILTKHLVAFVPAEVLQFGWMNPTIHSGRKRAAFRAVAAKFKPCETGSHRSGLHN